jgi:hypothetical protein
MAKLKSGIINSGNNIQLHYKKSFNDGYYIDNSITLLSKTPISIFGNHMEFIWEGIHENLLIKVIVPKGASGESARTEGLPLIQGLQIQIVDEVNRILRQLN